MERGRIRVKFWVLELDIMHKYETNRGKYAGNLQADPAFYLICFTSVGKKVTQSFINPGDLPFFKII